jgi:hypothetical protein
MRRGVQCRWFSRWSILALLLSLSFSTWVSRAFAQDETPNPIPQATPSSSPAAPVSDETDADEHLLASDEFRDSTSGWPNALVFDNYYIGYHEPEYYHVEVHAAGDKALAMMPGQRFEDATVETLVFPDAANTTAEGDFRYGLVVRREGSRYYAFTISPRSQRWYVLKSTPNSLEVLDEGDSSTILEEGMSDKLRVDAEGPNLRFYINEELVSEVSDGDYPEGATGFYVETLDSPRAHIHFDAIQIGEAKGPTSLLASDEFRDSTSGWPNALVFDNYYIGYHEPEYYHVEVHAAGDKALAMMPGQRFEDATVETLVFPDAANTTAEGDFRYGLVVRREGSRYYAFTISPRSQRWYVLKITPNSLEVLDEGDSSTILEEGMSDKLRVDAEGPNLRFYINEELVSEVSDGDYPEGATGFYVETLDSPRAHIHFDAIQIGEAEQSPWYCEVIVPFLNIRLGPGVEYRPPLGYVQGGDRLLPLGRNAAASWIRVRADRSGLHGWVSGSTSLVSCERPLQILPVSVAPPLR